MFNSVAFVFYKEAVMSDTLITLAQYNSLAARASAKAASVAEAASAAIGELAGEVKLTGDADIVISNTEPTDDDAYWIYFTDDEE